MHFKKKHTELNDIELIFGIDTVHNDFKVHIYAVLYVQTVQVLCKALPFLHISATSAKLSNKQGELSMGTKKQVQPFNFMCLLLM